ncbi:hypothetical protein JCM8547_003869 [Rhodosporidiobolus lusitaniae]
MAGASARAKAKEKARRAEQAAVERAAQAEQEELKEVLERLAAGSSAAAAWPKQANPTTGEEDRIATVEAKEEQEGAPWPVDTGDPDWSDLVKSNSHHPGVSGPPRVSSASRLPPPSFSSPSAPPPLHPVVAEALSSAAALSSAEAPLENLTYADSSLPPERYAELIIPLFLPEESDDRSIPDEYLEGRIPERVSEEESLRARLKVTEEYVGLLKKQRERIGHIFGFTTEGFTDVDILRNAEMTSTSTAHMRRGIEDLAKMHTTLEKATNLASGLAGEKDRWLEEKVGLYKERESFLAENLALKKERDSLKATLRLSEVRIKALRTGVAPTVDELKAISAVPENPAPLPAEEFTALPDAPPPPPSRIDYSDLPSFPRAPETRDPSYGYPATLPAVPVGTALPTTDRLRSDSVASSVAPEADEDGQPSAVVKPVPSASGGVGSAERFWKERALTAEKKAAAENSSRVKFEDYALKLLDRAKDGQARLIEREAEVGALRREAAETRERAEENSARWKSFTEEEMAKTRANYDTLNTTIKTLTKERDHLSRRLTSVQAAHDKLVSAARKGKGKETMRSSSADVRAVEAKRMQLVQSHAREKGEWEEERGRLERRLGEVEEANKRCTDELERLKTVRDAMHTRINLSEVALEALRANAASSSSAAGENPPLPSSSSSSPASPALPHSSSTPRPFRPPTPPLPPSSSSSIPPPDLSARIASLEARLRTISTAAQAAMEAQTATAEENERLTATVGTLNGMWAEEREGRERARREVREARRERDEVRARWEVRERGEGGKVRVEQNGKAATPSSSRPTSPSSAPPPSADSLASATAEIASLTSKLDKLETALSSNKEVVSRLVQQVKELSREAFEKSEENGVS